MLDQTKPILRSMLKENTGSHFLDSGGAYGRHWQRNQDRDFDSEPEVLFKFSRYGIEASINLYHWLADRLVFDPEMDRIFRLWASATPERREESYFALVGPFVESVQAKANAAGKHGRWGNYYPSEWSGQTINTYNGEDALSQVIQYTIFQARGQDYVLLSIHNGCDVRGGYTEPRVFTPREEATDLMSNASLTMMCSGIQHDDPSQLTLDGSPLPDLVHHIWDTDNAGCSWHDENYHTEDFEYEELPDDTAPEDVPALVKAETNNLILFYDSDGNGYCPRCGAKLAIYPGY